MRDSLKSAICLTFMGMWTYINPAILASLASLRSTSIRSSLWPLPARADSRPSRACLTKTELSDEARMAISLPSAMVRLRGALTDDQFGLKEVAVAFVVRPVTKGAQQPQDRV